MKKKLLFLLAFGALAACSKDDNDNKVITKLELNYELPNATFRLYARQQPLSMQAVERRN